MEEPGKLAGVLHLRDIRHIDKERWGTVVLRGADPARLLEHEPVVASPDGLLDDVTRRIADVSVTVVPVVERPTGTLVGSLTSSDIIASVRGEGKRGSK